MFGSLAQVSYPSSLLGLSGAFTSAMSTHVSSITNDQNRNISSDDTFDTCLPRVVAEVSCSRELEELQWFNVTVGLTTIWPSTIYGTTLAHSRRVIDSMLRGLQGAYL